MDSLLSGVRLPRLAGAVRLSVPERGISIPAGRSIVTNLSYCIQGSRRRSSSDLPLYVVTFGRSLQDPRSQQPALVDSAA